MAHAQKPDFVFRPNRRAHLNRQEASVQSTTGSRSVPISGSNAGYTMFRGSVKSTGFPLHPPVSPSLPLPCVTVCHHISTSTAINHSSIDNVFKKSSSTPQIPPKLCHLSAKQHGVIPQNRAFNIYRFKNIRSCTCSLV